MLKKIARKRILLIHLGAYGDCVIATTVARQIKVNYPDSHLTWVIAQRYSSVINNNPDVDAVWEFQLLAGEPVAPKAWYRCRAEAEKRKEAGEFELIFNTQIFPDNIRNFDGTTRTSTFRSYPHAITVPVTPVIRLFPEEVARIQAFAELNRLSSYKHVILMECAPGSGQSAFSLEAGLELSKRLTEARGDLVVIISTCQPFTAPHGRIIRGNTISYRDNAALTHYCTFLVGCSSGITWISTANASKQLNTVQFISRTLGASFASVAHDFKYWDLSAEHIIESTTTSLDVMFEIISAALEDFGEARRKHHQVLRPIFWSWLCCVDYRKGFYGIIGSWKTMVYYIKRNGLRLSDLFDMRALRRVIKEAKKRFL